MLKFTLNNAAMASAASSDSDTLPSGGHVSRLRAGWSVHEDGALAQRLQTEEISHHLQSNRQRNHQIREDLPRARQEQVREVESACKIGEIFITNVTFEMSICKSLTLTFTCQDPENKQNFWFDKKIGID